MAHPNVPGVLAIHFHFTIGSDANCHSHMYAHTTASALTTADLTTFAGVVNSSWTTNLKAWHHSAVVLTDVTVEDLGHMSTTIPGQAVGNIAGSRSGDVPNASQCVLILAHIARRYRGGKPRYYMPLLNGGDLQDPQHWNSTILASLTTQWASFEASVIAGSGAAAIDHYVNVGYVAGGAALPVPNVDAVTGFTLSATPGVQRRRLGR